MTKKAVTMSDIAKAMNVSTVTVSKALGDRDGVSAELRERIKQKATEMGYRVHADLQYRDNRSQALYQRRKFILLDSVSLHRGTPPEAELLRNAGGRERPQRHYRGNTEFRS